MLTLVHIQSSKTSSETAASLTADYLAFDRRRTERRQYLKAFGGMAVLVLLGAAFGRVPADEAWIVAGLLLVPPAILATIEAFQRRRLARRLDDARIQAQSVRKP